MYLKYLLCKCFTCIYIFIRGVFDTSCSVAEDVASRNAFVQTNTSAGFLGNVPIHPTPTPTLWGWGRDEHLFLIPKSLCEFADRLSCFLCCYCRSYPLIWVFSPVACTNLVRPCTCKTAPVTFASDTSSHLIIFREKNKNQTTRAGFCLTSPQFCSGSTGTVLPTPLTEKSWEYDQIQHLSFVK